MINKLIILLICSSLLTTTIQAQMDTLNGEPVYTIVEEMPYPKCCEEAENKNRCRDEYIVDFIYTNLNYPICTRGEEALVVVSFVIDNNGKLIHIKVVRESAPIFNDEVKRVVELMGMKMDWVAGRNAGEPVLVRFNIPVKFKWK